jgi:hypothetical protein
MNQKSFIGLAVVTGLAVLGAAVGVADRYSGSATGRSEALVFGGLAEKANDVAEIVIRSGDGTVTVRRGENGWVVPDKNGHPARSDKVRGTIIGLAELRLFEPKTRSANKYSRLQVEDVDIENSTSVLVKLADDKGTEMAKIIVGKARNNLAGPVSTGVYVRRQGSEQTWLARGRLVLSRSAEDWLLKEIVDVPSARVSQVTTRSGDGVVFGIAKKTEKDVDFAIVDLPGDAKLKKSARGSVNGLAGVLGGMELEDVVTASEFDRSQSGTATVKTFDGLTVELALFADDKETWVRLTATGDGPAAEEAARINAGVGGWVYRVPAHKAAFLKMRLDGLLDTEEKDKSS